MRSSSSIKWRLRLVAGGITLFALIIAGNLYKTQIFSHEAYVLKADRQYASTEGDIFDRGYIYFQSKSGDLVSAAGIKEGNLIVMVPSLIKNPESVYNSLSKIIPLNHEDFLNKAKKTGSQYAELAKHVEIEVGDKIQALNFAGIRVQKERWRFYPGNELAAHVIGYYGFGKDSILEGQYGLERFYEPVLTRKDDASPGNFLTDLFTNIKKTVVEGEEMTGDVVSSVEPTVEHELEDTLMKVKSQWSPDLVGGIIMDPKTGEIYAMGALPSYNPNSYGSASNTRAYTNPLVQDRYEMGSIMKPLTMAAGLDSGVITPNSTYDDKGFITLNGKTIRNFDGKGRGNKTPMQQILSQSLNTGASYIALLMGKDRFPVYMNNYGLGVETGIDQPYEIKGDLRNLKSGRDVELATASFGQGIAVTPMEMTRALATLANGGMLVTPHLADKINYRIGTSKTVAGGSGVRVLKKETTDAVTKMLITVVDLALKKGAVKMDRWSVAAKTGTAQIADSSTSKYYSDRYLHSFFGYFPASNPRFIIFLYQVYPKGATYASETLTDPFMRLTKFLISYYEIAPDR
ncbi:MAG: penicillin-binding protein 2 [bacterium]